MRNINEYEAFGYHYRFKELSAVDSFGLLLKEREEETPPLFILIRSEGEIYDEESKTWIKLDTREAVNKYVKDRLKGIGHWLVLNALLLLIKEQNVGFIIHQQWKPLKVPSKLLSSTEPIRLEHVDPVIGTLVANHLATLKELQEFYSLKDAFDMFDVYSADSLSKAMATDAAVSEAKRK